MRRESHDEFLRASARRALAKARERRQQERWSAGEIAAVKIQTVEPWKRILLGVLGVGTATGAVLLFSAENRMLGVVLVVVSLLLAVVALVGIRKTIATALNGADLLEIVGGVVDLIDL